jgi:hypothetical protein
MSSSWFRVYIEWIGIRNIDGIKELGKGYENTVGMVIQ